MDIDRDRGMTSDADHESDTDRDPAFGGGMSPGGNPAQDQPGFNQDAAADTYPTRDTTGVNQGMNQDPDYNRGMNQGMNQDPAYGSGMDQGTDMGGSPSSTGNDPNAGASSPGTGGGVGDVLQRARGKVEETVGRMTNNPDLQQQGINRQAQSGGQAGTADATDTTDTTDATDATGTTGTTGRMNQDPTADTYDNP